MKKFLRREDGAEKTAQTATPTRFRWDAAAMGPVTVGRTAGEASATRDVTAGDRRQTATAALVGEIWDAPADRWCKGCWSGFEGLKFLRRECSGEVGV
jgi:hypothetical protein